MNVIERARKQWKDLYFNHCLGIMPTAFLSVIKGDLKQCELLGRKTFKYDLTIGKFTLTTRTGRVLETYDPVLIALYSSTLYNNPTDRYRFIDTEENGKRLCYDFLDIDVPATLNNGNPAPTRGRFLINMSGKDTGFKMIDIIYNDTVTVKEHVLQDYEITILSHYMHRVVEQQ